LVLGQEGNNDNDDSGDDGLKKKKKTINPADKSVPCQLELDDEEWPIIPADLDDLDPKDVMRSFMTLTYSVYYYFFLMNSIVF
jgi:hypothetical protein